MFKKVSGCFRAYPQVLSLLDEGEWQRSTVDSRLDIYVSMSVVTFPYKWENNGHENRLRTYNKVHILGAARTLTHAYWTFNDKDDVVSCIQYLVFWGQATLTTINKKTALTIINKQTALITISKQTIWPQSTSKHGYRQRANILNTINKHANLTTSNKQVI